MGLIINENAGKIPAIFGFHGPKATCFFVITNWCRSLANIIKGISLRPKLSALAFLFFATHSINAQAQTMNLISADFNNLPMRDALELLEKKYQVSFSYDDELLKGLKISVRFQQKTLSEAMQRMLHGKAIDYEIVNDRDVLLIRRKEAPEPESLASSVLRKFKGRVLIMPNLVPLPAASVFLSKTGQGSITNEDGTFFFETPINGIDTLVISYVGYQKQKYPLAQTGILPFWEVKLKPATEWISNVTVQDFATDMVRFDSSGRATLFKPERMPTLPGWGQTDVTRLLQLLPGVTSPDESAAALNVRGGTPDQNLILWDQIPIYHPSHFFGLYDGFNPQVVQDVQFFSGNFGAEYGGRTSSVINLASKPVQNDGKMHGGVAINLLNLSAHVSAPLVKNKLQLMLGTRRSYSDLFKSGAFQSLFNQIFQNSRIDNERRESTLNRSSITWRPDFYFFDFNSKLLFTPNKKTELHLSTYRSKDALDYFYKYDDQWGYFRSLDKFLTQNTGLSAGYKSQWNDKFSVNYVATLSDFGSDYNYELAWNRESALDYGHLQRNTLSDLGLKLQHQYRFSPQSSLNFGYQTSNYRHKVSYLDTSITQNKTFWKYADSSRAWLHTIYGEAQMRLTKDLLLELGYRENYYVPHQQFYSEPRFFLQWTPPKKSFRLRASFGKYYQFLYQANEWNSLGVGDASWLIANEDLPVQETWQGALGMQWQSEKTLFSAETYLKKQSNLTSVTLVLEPDIDNPWTFDGTSTIRGLDILFRQRWKKYSLWTSYTFGSVQQYFPGLNRDQPFPARHDIRHNFNFVHMLTFGGLSMSLNYHFNTGVPFAEPDTILTVKCDDCFEGVTQKLGYQRLNTGRLPGTHRVDFSLNWRIEAPRWYAKLGFSVYNLLNRENLLDRDYFLNLPPKDQQQIGEIQRLNRRALGRTPNLVLQIGF
jgi:hypothetical protein